MVLAIRGLRNPHKRIPLIGNRMGACRPIKSRTCGWSQCPSFDARRCDRSQFIDPITLRTVRAAVRVYQTHFDGARVLVTFLLDLHFNSSTQPGQSFGENYFSINVITFKSKNANRPGGRGFPPSRKVGIRGRLF